MWDIYIRLNIDKTFGTGQSGLICEGGLRSGVVLMRGSAVYYISGITKVFLSRIHDFPRN